MGWEGLDWGGFLTRQDFLRGTVIRGVSELVSHLIMVASYGWLIRYS